MAAASKPVGANTAPVNSQKQETWNALGHATACLKKISEAARKWLGDNDFTETLSTAYCQGKHYSVWERYTLGHIFKREDMEAIAKELDSFTSTAPNTITIQQSIFTKEEKQHALTIRALVWLNS